MRSRDAGVSESVELPECRIPAAVQPAGFLRFSVTESQAKDVLSELSSEYEEIGPDPGADAFVPIRFVLDETAMTAVYDGLVELESNFPQMGAVSVMLTPDPDFVLTVLLNAQQIQELTAVEPESVDVSSDDSEPRYTQEFQLTSNAALVAMRQIELAVDGVEEPVEAIDFQKLREESY